MRTSQKIAVSCAVLAISMAFASDHASAQYGAPSGATFAGPGSLNFNGMSKGSHLNDSSLGGAQTNVAPVLTPTPGGLFNFASPQGIGPAQKHR